MRRSWIYAGNLVPTAGQDYLFAPEFQAIQHGFEVFGEFGGSYENHSFSDNQILLDIASTFQAGIRGYSLGRLPALAGRGRACRVQ
jgi:hypothetical protein